MRLVLVLSLLLLLLELRVMKSVGVGVGVYMGMDMGMCISIGIVIVIAIGTGPDPGTGTGKGVRRMFPSLVRKLRHGPQCRGEVGGRSRDTTRGPIAEAFSATNRGGLACPATEPSP